MAWNKLKVFVNEIEEDIEIDEKIEIKNPEKKRKKSKKINIKNLLNKNYYTLL